MQPRPILHHLPLGIAGVRAAFAALMLFIGIAPVSAQTITTVAGGAICDNASALAVSVAPGGTAVDAAGNLYVAALTSHAVCKITPGGVISHVAGTGTAGFSGDGGAATSAQLNYPNHIVLDGNGNLYIADSSNQRIRKVTPAGTISTFAGGGFGGDGSAATAASLNFPSGLAFDGSGNLYIADTTSHRIRKVTAADGKINTIAGTGTAGYSGDGAAAASAQLNSPYGIALDGAGNVYVADRLNHRIRKITAVDGKIATIAGNGVQGYSGDGGPATAAQLFVPHAVAVDAGGNNIYIADWQNHRLRKITTADGKIATIAGNGGANYSGDNGPAAAAQLEYPTALSLDATGNLFVSDYNNFRVRKIAAADASITSVAGNGTPGWSGDGGAATSAQLGTYLHIAVDATGNLYIADNENHRIRKVATDGTISTFAGNGTQGFSGDGGAATSAQLNSPGGIAFDGAGNLYIAEQLGQRVRKVATDGTISTFAGNGVSDFSGDGGPAAAARLSFPMGVAADSAGNVYIADTSNSRIRKVGSDGKINTIVGNGTQGYAGDNGAALNAQLSGPSAIKLDRTGNLYIADTSNHRVRKVTADGNIATIAGTGAQGYSGDGGAATDAQLLLPSGLAFNPLGELNIADWYANSVRKIAANGVIDRIAGSGGGNRGFGGDNGPAIDALLSSPYDIAFDAAGNLYIADGANRRIRKVASSYAQSGTSLRIETVGPHVYGESLTITVTVGASYVPTGKVDVCLDGDPDPDTFCWPNFVFPCTDLPLSPSATSGEYVATCTTSTLPAGDHSIAALYSGDTFNLRSFNLVSPVTITKASQVIAGFASTPASPTYTPNGTFTVSASGGDSTNPVVFASTTPTVCSVSGNQVTMLAAGTCSLSANQDGDANHFAAAQVMLDVPLGLVGTSTTISPTNPSVYGQSVTLTATVDAAAATGTITFSEGATVLCAAVAMSNHSATCPLPASALTVGGHDFIAKYSGDATYATSTSAPLHHTINKAASTLAVTAIAPGSITLGQSATVTVALSATAPGAGTPTGTITVSDGTVSCSFSTPANNNCAITPTATGARPISATYSGDANFLASAAAGGFLLVNDPPPTQSPTLTTLSLAPNPVTTSQVVTATLGVSGGSAPTGTSLRASANASPAALSGTVVVSGGGQQCTATLDGTGAGSCTLSYATPGSYTVTASYSGDTQHAPSSASANLVVNMAVPPAATVAAPALSWWALLGLIVTLAVHARRAIARR